MKIKAVIFDLDGTILDTLDDLTAAVNHALCAVGRHALLREEVRRFVGNGVKKLIERALAFTAVEAGKAGERGGADDDFDTCMRVFTEFYDAHSADMTKPYDGMREAIVGLKAAGYKTAVVTNKYDAAAQALRVKFFPETDAVVGVSDGVKPKPAPDGVYRALRLIGAKIDECVFVGDGETDIATAKNCGIPVIAVTWGFRDGDALEALAPDAVVYAPDELIFAVKGLSDRA